MLKRIPSAERRWETERLRTLYSRWCEERGHESASATLEQSWEGMVTFYDYPEERGPSFRTTNPVESQFTSSRLKTDTVSDTSECIGR